MLATGLAACGLDAEPSLPPTFTIADTGVDSAEAIAAMSPVQLTESFYRWHLSFPGNPLLHTRDKWTEYFTPSFIHDVEMLLNSFRDSPGGFDPFLCAQNIPAVFTVSAGDQSGAQAGVLVRMEWGPGSSATEVTVGLVQDAGRWWIAEIVCPAPGSSDDSFSWQAGYVLG